MDKLASLKTFITVVESGGFSATARRLGVSKALISKQVAQLEENLGIRLLHRTTRHVSPTSMGQAYYERCKPLLDDLNELDESIQSSDRALQGELRISAPTTFAEMHLLPIISLYSKQNPGVNLTLELTDRFVNLVEERVDLAIRIGSLEDSTLVARRMGEIRLLLCATPEFIKTHGHPASLQELSDKPCIVDSNNPTGNQWSLLTEHGQQSVTVEQHVTVNNARAARDLVLDSNGIGFLPSFVVQNHLHSGELVNLFGHYSSSPIGIYAVYLHRKHLSLRVRKLIELLADTFQSKFDL